jgi:hypothetical protein
MMVISFIPVRFASLLGAIGFLYRANKKTGDPYRIASRSELAIAWLGCQKLSGETLRQQLGF